MIDKYVVELERARAIAVLLENELYALKQQLKQEREYCQSVADNFAVHDHDSAEMWQLAAHRIECVERLHMEIFG